ILAALAAPAALTYEPTPKGLHAARAAVAAYYARRHAVAVDADRVTLTASTSEAYSWLFKLVCDPGDDVLVPSPSYPLFDHLAALESVRPVAYPLRYHGGWFVDIEEVRRALTPRTRAILVVNPNNPTGSFLTRDQAHALAALAAERDLPLVSDEVFADYGFQPDPARLTTLAGERACLTFCLSGLSKLVGLPQLKLGWIVVGGPDARRAEAESRLELIADTYLSVAAPVQHAAPSLLALVDDVGAQIAARVRENRATIAAAVAGTPAQLLEAEGGWSAIVRLPSTSTEEEWVLALLDDGVLVHPGFFFDLPPTSVVISLLIAPATLAAALPAILRRCTH
ncbi:MAG TPA: pyridoxal phosphate-dependent aminotransferase, partial [Polyangia bacterium]|nr:pyridoxal phosphate-dependent aminotransferase [Polyangia bacterium]